MKFSITRLLLLFAAFVPISGCEKPQEEAHHEHHKILVTCPMVKDVINTQQYVCQIHSYRHIEVRAMESGYLEAIQVKEGQTVRQGDSLFKIVTTLYEAKLDAEVAEAQLAEIEFTNTQKLFQQKVVAQPEVSLAQAKLAKAKAKVKLSQAELNFANIKAPFDGIIDHQRHQQGSLISEGDILTTLSDNSTMWVYFNVPESRYLEYQARPDKDDIKIELMLANGEKFPQIGKIGAIEADFNNETGNIAFRADFPNPDRLLRHGQTGTILISRVVKDAVVIPQRATFEILAKKYAFVVEDNQSDEGNGGAERGAKEYSPKAHVTHEGKEGAAHDEPDHGKGVVGHGDKHPAKHENPHGIVRQREIVILNETDDIFLIKDGLGVNDRIILEGIRQVRDGDEVEYEYQSPEQALNHLKYHAE
ncbi:MAG: efflux RND transporter periplasmic adaptor subunit [Pirellula sp.]